MSVSISPESEAAALGTIAAATEIAKLEKLRDNARGKSAVVERAAFDRIVALRSAAMDEAIAKDCWTMIYAVEEIRRVERGRRTPMVRLRGKIRRDGELAALEYLALNKSDGFAEVVGYGVPELLAEVIVIKHGAPSFSASAVMKARGRLADNGFSVEDLLDRLSDRSSA